MEHVYQHLIVTRLRGLLFVTLNRPETRNALGAEVVAEMDRAIAGAPGEPPPRAVILRGSGGFFSAGGNVGNFSAHLGEPAPQPDPVAARNREFGRFMERLAALPMPVIAAVEGAAMGGGMGLACAADIVLATRDARFALSETRLGLIPAQIAPFVVARLGLRVARRLGISGERIHGEAALRLGMADELADDSASLDILLARWLSDICACAPRANALIKPLLAECSAPPAAANGALDRAAALFARCLRDEGAEGIEAFRKRQPPRWAETIAAEDVRQACTSLLVP
ncbi:enoyl-CoA hydratase/isomerase family protein 30 [Achromobacter xylosoxidans A8]|uniref:Enoyl-CoA hydratase/isomerase family protein 30 n=2 Tax=Achromobacter TaxID=222 RepID=E3HRH5_ACHXA|nr:enoyl-CoA hydratase-related protein [Achromobacter xylosoxidans]ADP18453.1 enoyl-CoA hydratase/isomerase family protein 30 [Achromobacter xylosoxidans A8]